MSSSKESYTFPKPLMRVREGRCSIVGEHPIICLGTCSYNHLPLKKKTPSTLSCGVSSQAEVKAEEKKRKETQNKRADQTKKNSRADHEQTKRIPERANQILFLTPPCRPFPQFAHASIRLREQLPQLVVDAVDGFPEDCLAADVYGSQAPPRPRSGL